MRISASAINDTQECELKGFWKYVEKRKGSVESPYGVFGSCLHASIADIINKELKQKDKKFNSLPVLISGGTNSFTGQLARQCGVDFNGITIGTHARKVISQFRKTPSSLTSEELNKAISQARNLITMNLYDN